MAFKNFFRKMVSSTEAPFEVNDIREEVEKALQDSKVQNGIAVVFTPHPTCSIKLNKDDENLIEDIKEFLEKRVPQNQGYKSDMNPGNGRKNAHAHLKSLLLNSSECIPIQNGKLMLGDVQSVYFVELDGPREKRNVIIQVMGE
jgi:secondary thiamine-phosphate synthase enzyme